MNRSDAPEVRNPVLALPAAAELAALAASQPAVAQAMHHLLRDLGDQASDKAEVAWRQRKAPMAAYWRAVSVYARHTAAALRRTEGRPML